MKLKKSLEKSLTKPIKAQQVWVMDESGHKRGFYGWYQVKDARLVSIHQRDEILLLKIDTGINK